MFLKIHCDSGKTEAAICPVSIPSDWRNIIISVSHVLLSVRAATSVKGGGSRTPQACSITTSVSISVTLFERSSLNIS